VTQKRKKIAIYSISFFLLFIFTYAFPVDKSTALLIEKELEKNIPEIIKIRRYLHMNPELSNREFETAKLVASRLMALGLDIKTRVAKTGVTALLRGEQEGLTVAIRADMDALPIQEMTNLPYKSLNPGVMHACGHDIHTSIVLGSAMVLQSLRDKIKGNIKFIFQPAEEGPPPGEEGGANLMIQEGVLEDPPVAAIMGFHVWPENIGEIYFTPGPLFSSSDTFQIGIQGKSSHGAKPHEGIDAIVIASHVIISLQSIISRSLDPTDPAVLTIGTIKGGTKANIIAERVILEGTVRTLTETNRMKAAHIIDEITRGITSSFGADYTLEYRKGPPPLYNHPELAKDLLPTLKTILGETKVKTIKPQMVSEDFSFYCQKIPGFYFLLGVKSLSQNSMAPLHSPYFNPDEKSLSLGLKLVCHLLIDCLEKMSPHENDAS